MKLITLLALLSIAGCELPDSATGSMQADSFNPVVTLMNKNGTIEIFEYLQLYFNKNRGVFVITTPNGDMVKPIDSFNSFTTSETNQKININILGTGDTIIQYHSLYYNDRNILTINGNSNSLYYGIDYFNNFTTSQ